MTNQELASDGGLLARIKGILLEPKLEWPKIGAEPATVGSLYTSYIVPLAGFAVLCAFIRSLLGVTIFGVTYRTPYFESLISAAWQLGTQLVGIFVVALIMDMLAPIFGGERNRINALKLAAYSATAGWLSNVFVLIPWLGFLTILGVYTLYLVYTGVPVLMKVPQNRALGFTATLVAISIVLAIVLFGITATILPSEPVADEPGTTQDEAPSGTLSIPGIGRIDLGKLNEMGKRLETMSKGGEGTLRPIDAVEFKALLPLMLPGNYKRTETDTSAAVGIGIATASGSYKNGENTIMLSITDMGMAGAMAALTGALGANSSEETADSYSRLKTIDGRMTMEEYNSKAKTGTYSFMVADRIMVKAKGHGASIDELKASAHTIDTARVEALAQN